MKSPTSYYLEDLRKISGRIEAQIIDIENKLKYMRIEMQELCRDFISLDECIQDLENNKHDTPKTLGFDAPGGPVS